MKHVKEIVEGVEGDVGLLCHNKKEEFVTRTALMFIMTNTPFHVASNPYFKDWLLNINVIKSENEAPFERAISDTGLNRLQAKCSIIEVLKRSPEYICCVFDCWMDSSKRHFFAIILRFINDDFQQIEFVIAFKCLEYKTSNQESEIFDRALAEYELSSKKFIAISDNGSDMLKLCRIRSMTHLDCLAHALHNLINADVIPKTRLVKNFMKKFRAIIATFRYRTNDLKTDLRIDTDAERAKWLQKLCEIGK